MTEEEKREKVENRTLKGGYFRTPRFNVFFKLDDPTHVWVYRAEGDGGEFDLVKFENLLEKFMKEEI